MLRSAPLSGLAGIRARFERAQALIRELELRIELFLEEQRSQIVESREGNRRVWTYTGATAIPPGEYAVRVGEIVHNLRSSLDHVVWQLVIGNGQEPGSRNAYPICATAGEYDERRQSRLHGVHQGAQEIIRRNEPWWPSDHGFELWSLHRMSNEDKHRHLPMIAVRPVGLVNYMLPDSHEPTTQTGRGEMYSGPLTKGKIVCCFTDIPDNYDPGIDLSLIFLGGRSEPDGAVLYGYMGRPVIRVLRGCLKDVGTVLQDLSVFLN